MKYIFLILLGVFLSSCDTEDVSAGSDTDWELISAGFAHTCGLHSDGIVECWGCEGAYDFGQCTVPAGNFLTVDAGGFHTCGISTSGFTVCWGCDGNFFGENVNKGQCNPPGWVQYDMLDMGFFHSYALKDRETECWGCQWEDDNWNLGQCWDD